MAHLFSRYMAPAGYALIAVTSLLFFFRTRYNPSDLLLDEAAVFLINYVLSVIYFLGFPIDPGGRQCGRKIRIPHHPNDAQPTISPKSRL